MVSYDQYYKTEDLFGKPYPELMEFFAHLPKKGKVLDLGCGQGRDAIAIARMGYTVTGIDDSKVGIQQLNAIADYEKLDLTGTIMDIYAFDDFQEYDIILLDSTILLEKTRRRSLG